MIAYLMKSSSVIGQAEIIGVLLAGCNGMCAVGWLQGMLMLSNMGEGASVGSYVSRH